MRVKDEEAAENRGESREKGQEESQAKSSESGLRIALAAAALAILCAFGASALPVPLMGEWTDAYGLTGTDVSLTVGAYIAGCFAAFLFLARLSERFGRRPAVMIGLIAGMASTVCFLAAQSAEMLFLGRFLQGISCGIMSTAAMSWAVDAAPPDAAWVGTAVNAAGPIIGFTIATICAGGLLAADIAGTHGIFMGLLLVQAGALAVTFPAAETMTKRKTLGALRPGFIPPPGSGRKLMVAASAYITGSAVTSFFQGYSAQTAGFLWGDHGAVALLSSAVYLLLIIPNAAGGFAAARLNAERFILPSLLALTIAGTAAFAAIALQSPMLFIPAIAVTGAAIGASSAGGIAVLLEGSRMDERARLLSAFYIFNYLGTGIPCMGIAAAGRSADAAAAAWVYGVWLAAGTAVAAYFLKRLEKAKCTREAGERP